MARAPSLSRLAPIVGCLICLLARVTAAQTVIFHDDFTGSTLSNARWSVGGWVKGRSQFGNTPVVSGGFASLRFDTYNPAAPGQTMKGTSMTVRTPFSRPPVGLELEARVRTHMMPGGLLTSFFTYGEDASGKSDEIDFEFLSNTFSNRTGGDRYSLTSWNDWDAENPDPNNPARRATEVERMPGLDVTTWNTLTIRWLPTRTEWLINGQVVRSSTDALPDESMSLSLNFWAPLSSWISAYNAALQPAATAAANQSYFYDVDYVTVRTVPEPTAIAGMLTGAYLLIRRRARGFGP